MPGPVAPAEMALQAKAQPGEAGGTAALEEGEILGVPVEWGAPEVALRRAMEAVAERVGHVVPSPPARELEVQAERVRQGGRRAVATAEVEEKEAPRILQALLEG
ncbi:MAG TPA: hypothetical protein VNT79_11690 [Phycisphaerae bacterium]|nr:hypothetical protein [Phycisphaerae bacterium]